MPASQSQPQRGARAPANINRCLTAAAAANNRGRGPTFSATELEGMHVKMCWEYLRFILPQTKQLPLVVKSIHQ